MTRANKAWSVALFLVAVFWSVGASAKDAEQKIVVQDVGLSTPESVEYYPAEDVYLVSNINGDPSAIDGNGFISKLKPDGSVIALKWIDGTKKGITLNAPKGAVVMDSYLFIADVNQVQVFDLPSGKQKTSIDIDGATFLNGATPGPEGSVYVTDSGFNAGFKPSGTDAVYQVWPDGHYETILKNKEMGHPNGIWDHKGQLIVNTLGSGKMFDVSPNGMQTELPSPPKGSLDGLVELDDGSFLVTSWDASAIYRLDKKGNYTVFADSLKSPADIGVDTKRHRVLVPLFLENKVVILPLDGKKAE